VEIITLIALTVVAMILLAYGAVTECETCHRWWAEALESSTLLERWQEPRQAEYGVVPDDSAKNPPASAPESQNILITMEKRANKYRCRKCGTCRVEIETSEV